VISHVLVTTQSPIETIRAHLTRGDLDDGLVFDAVRVRLIEIGEAVKTLLHELLVSSDTVPSYGTRLLPNTVAAD